MNGATSIADTAQKNDTEAVLRKRITQTIEKLPVEDLFAVERYASYLLDVARDPFLRAHLNAPFEDEEVTPEEEALVQEGRDALATGDVIGDDDLWRELGHDLAS